MKCVMCPCTDISLLKLQTYVDHNTLKEIIFVLPKLVLNFQEPVFVCATCLEEVASSFAVKKSCLDNLRRFRNYHDILKEESDSRASDLNVVITSEEASSQRKQDIEFKINSHREDSLSYAYQQVSNSSNDKEFQTQHAREKSQLKCLDCDKIFPSRSQLERHTRVHTGNRPYTCPTCQKSFATSSTLNRHNLTHTGDKPHECDICYKKFAYNSHLITHKRIHSNVRPYQCAVCNRTFTDSRNLSSHMRTHTGEKPYQCHVCQYKCAQAGTLNRHYRSHTGKKP